MISTLLHQSRVSAALVACACLLILGGCKSSGSAAARNATVAQDPMKVKVTPELLASIKVGTAEMQEVTTKQTAAARIQTDASRVARIGSPVEGRITSVLVFEGQKVHQGQVLARLHSNALSDTQFAFIKAFSQSELAQKSAERAQQLVKMDVIGAAELQKREVEVLQTTAELAALRAQLRGLGMSEKAIQQLETTRKLNSDYPILASISGTVIERKITVGQVVQPAEAAFMVADLSRLWLVAEVPEEQSGSLYIGKTVIAKIPAVPQETVSGKLSFVSPVVNPETRTVQARMDLFNPLGLFKPDMLATMTFESRPVKGLTIPSAAVVREADKDSVLLKTSADQFTLHEVQLGAEVNDRRVVSSGLSPADAIILEGSFHVNNKRKQDQVKGGE